MPVMSAFFMGRSDRHSFGEWFRLRGPKDGADSCDPDGKVIMLEKCLATAGTGNMDERRVGCEVFEELDGGTRVAGIDLPSTVEALDDQGRGGILRTDVENGAASGHEAIGLAGDDGAEGRRVLRDEADVAGPEGRGELMAGAITGKRDVGV